MSYQVLARKWRPKTFHEMVGQTHVLKALINALDNDRLHHAYLYTGTRGVGKTTIARIFAKSLNCEQGVSSTPCGVCGACVEVNEGRFIDLIEVDAASRTKVEDTRELLENVQYAPTRGRYKVYLIDEVHMLSGHSFNALLKTLEEPPEHVKFLLATTDPQKLPATILSRCLQFNLKNMTPEMVVGHLQNVLTAEKIPFDEPSLWHIGRAAHGSMRDAMSLTDQAIAYGQGKIAEADIVEMLGTVDTNQVQEILALLLGNDGKGLLKKAKELGALTPDFVALLDELLSILHRVAIAQTVPQAVDQSKPDAAVILKTAQSCGAEQIQLLYQLGVLAKKDLFLAPDSQTGFEMALLRMLAFAIKPLSSAPQTLNAGQPETQAPTQAANQETLNSPQPTAPVSQPPQESAPEPAVDQVQITHEQEIAPASQPDDQITQAASSQEPPFVNNDIPPFDPQDLTQVPKFDDQEAFKNEEAVVANEQEEAPLVESSPIPSEPSNVNQGVNESSLQTLDHSQASTESLNDVNEPLQERKEPVPLIEETTNAEITNPGAAEVKEVLRDEPSFELGTDQWWIYQFEALNLTGMTKSIFAAGQWLGNAQQATLNLGLQHQRLYNETHLKRLMDALAVIGLNTNLDVQFVEPSDSPVKMWQRKKEAALKQATIDMQQDPRVLKLIEMFDAKIIETSIKPLTQ